MILLEKNIFSGLDTSEYENAKKDSDKMNALKELLKEAYPKYNVVINGQGAGIENIFLNSILLDGADTNSNLFIAFMDKVLDRGIRFSTPEMALIYNIIEGSDYIDRIDQNTEYLFDRNNYNPLYKIKALIFLNSSRADRFGEKAEKEELINRVKRAQTEDEIKELLSEWQTKEGNELTGEEILLNILEEKSFKDSSPIAEIRKYIKQTEDYKKLSNTSTIDANLEDNIEDLKKLLSNKYETEEKFKTTISKYIKENK